MVQNPSWEANWSAASQETPRISRNPKVHYRTHKRPPPVSILGQANPVHIHTSDLLEIHPNIIRPSTLRSPQWSPSLLKESSISRILHKDLHYYPYKITVAQELSEGDKVSQHQFCNILGLGAKQQWHSEHITNVRQASLPCVWLCE